MVRVPPTVAYTPLVRTSVVVVFGSVYSQTGDDCPRSAPVELVASMRGNAGNAVKVAARRLGSGTALPAAPTCSTGEDAEVLSRV